MTLYRIVMSRKFEFFILAVILLNVVALMMEYEGMSMEYKDALEMANVVFTIIFVVEAVVKIMALTFRGYWTDAWNRFDFIVAFVGAFDIMFRGSAVVTVFRLFRAARLAKLLHDRGTRRLLWTFWQSLKDTPFVIALLMMLFYMYAVVGMTLFGRVQQSDDRAINDHAHFRTLGASLLLLLRCATGEDWQRIMVDVDLSGSECDSNAEGGSTCGSSLSVIFFTSFICISTILVLNIFVAIIMDNFDYLFSDVSRIDVASLDDFVDAVRPTIE